MDTPGLDTSLELSQFQTSFNFSSSPPSKSSSTAMVPSFTIQRKYGDSLIAAKGKAISTSTKLEPPSWAGGLCPFCKGKKYGFTAYFHNLRIFPEPPHAILPLVEESYILRDRLKSLLVSYAMREFEHDEAVMAQIHHWEFSMEALTDDVMNSASTFGFVLNLGRLDDVRKWMSTIVDEFRYYTSGQARDKMASGRLAALMAEYRKIWELVWIGYLRDRKAMQAEPCGNGYPSITLSDFGRKDTS